MSLISIIVPVYKVESYLERCVQSVLNQTLEDFELILVDDGSPDNCPEMCDEFATKDNRIHVIHQENKGLSAARNAGIDWAFEYSKSKWVTFIDSDDWIHPQYLEMLYEVALNEKIDICLCEHREEIDIYEFSHKQGNRYKKYRPEDYWITNFNNAVVAWGKLYKKECFSEIRFPIGKITEDAYTTHKILFRYETIAVIEYELYYYFQREDSIMNRPWDVKRLDEVWALKEQMVYFEQNGFEKALQFILNKQIDYLIMILRVLIKNNREQKYVVLVRKELQSLLKKHKNVINEWKNGNVFAYKVAYLRYFEIEKFIRKKKEHVCMLYKEHGVLGILNKLCKK